MGGGVRVRVGVRGWGCRCAVITGGVGGVGIDTGVGIAVSGTDGVCTGGVGTGAVGSSAGAGVGGEQTLAQHCHQLIRDVPVDICRRSFRCSFRCFL